MKFIDTPSGCFCDRKITEPDLEPIDIITLTLDAENFLEKCLYSVYREVPVKRLLVCDGGSKDSTLEILKKFPRVEVFVKPEIRTTGKAIEFLILLAETKWFMLVDADIELSPGWYDEMSKHKNKYDVLENSRLILAYHKYREYTEILEPNSRSSSLCHLIQKEAVKNFHCDDDYMWRYTDFLLRQVVEKSGYKYGKISSTRYVHNETERIPYASDEEKSYQKLIIRNPEWIITDKKKAKLKDIQNAKAFVKYLDPNFTMVKENVGFDYSIRSLDRKWVKENAPSWLKRYDKSHSISFTIKYFLTNLLSKNKTISSIGKKFHH